MASNLPEPPLKVPMLDDSGRLSPAWAGWIRDLNQRVGGKRALTNLELEEVQTVDLQDLQNDVIALQFDNAAVQNLIAALTLRVTALELEPVA